MELMEIKNGKVTSLELVKEINFFRNKDEKRRVNIEHKSLLGIIRNEFEEEINEQEILPVNYKDGKGELRPMFELTINQAKQVLVRESKLVRKAVIKRLDELETLPQLSEMEMIAKIANNSIEQEKRISAIEYKFENILTIDSGKQRKLQKAIAIRVIDRCSGIFGDTDEEFKKRKSKFFSAIHRELKNKFGISSYKDVKTCEFENAINWVRSWVENADVRELS